MDSTNWLGVFLAALASFVLGWVWYGVLFRKTWMHLSGLTMESMRSMKLTATQAMAGGFVVSLVTAYVLNHFILVLGITTISAVCSLTIWIWLGFLATNTIGSFLWEGHSFKLFLLNTVEQFIAIHLVGFILVWMM